MKFHMKFFISIKFQSSFDFFLYFEWNKWEYLLWTIAITKLKAKKHFFPFILNNGKKFQIHIWVSQQFTHRYWTWECFQIIWDMKLSTQKAEFRENIKESWIEENMWTCYTKSRISQWMRKSNIRRWAKRPKIQRKWEKIYRKWINWNEICYMAGSRLLWLLRIHKYVCTYIYLFLVLFVFFFLFLSFVGFVLLFGKQ